MKKGLCIQKPIKPTIFKNGFHPVLGSILRLHPKNVARDEGGKFGLGLNEFFDLTRRTNPIFICIPLSK